MPSDQDEVDMETFQRLSDNYQPDVQGPLIRHRHPIQSLMGEFRNADPTYVTKTAALAASYSQYRPVKGDGQCGWRAVVFGYFECLMRQSTAKIALEKARLQSFNDTLVAVGYDFGMVELFVEETMELFESLHRMIESGDRKDDVLLDIFNAENRSNSIVFHFKLLTSAIMKLNPEQYQPYLEQPLFEYCQSNIDAFGQEIEQISLQALTDGVIAPAHISVVVMYLDRSEGGEVTPHHLVANAGSDWPTITLLYRPGHYDMIYKAAPIHAHRVEFGTSQNDFIPTGSFGFGSRPSDIRVLSHLNEDRSMTQHYPDEPSSPFSHRPNVLHDHYATAVIGPKNPPDFPEAPTTALGLPSSGYESAYMSADMSVPLFESSAGGYGVLTPESSYGSFNGTMPPFPQYCHPPMLLPPQQYSSPPATSPIHSISPGRSPRKQELQIRMSQPCFEMGQRHHEILPLETGPFKNSPFNTGHFANPKFQPLMWNAENDYI